MDTARRYNKGKLRYELISTIGLKQLADVYTKGAEKYTLRDDSGKIIDDGANNWKKGSSWMTMIASVQRHIESWKSGEDIDELTTHHLANAAWGLITLLDYQETHPQGDDRPHLQKKPVKIALDLDDVCASFLESWCELYNLEMPSYWNFDVDMHSRINRMKDNGTWNDFLLQLDTKIDPSTLPFEPIAYVTARHDDSSEATIEWLKNKGFPIAPVYFTNGESKLQILKELNVDIFIDDSYKTFLELNSNGICCFLMDGKHNNKYNVGSRRIHNFDKFK